MPSQSIVHLGHNWPPLTIHRREGEQTTVQNSGSATLYASDPRKADGKTIRIAPGEGRSFTDETVVTASGGGTDVLVTEEPVAEKANAK